MIRQIKICIGKSGISQRKRGILPDGLLEVALRRLQGHSRCELICEVIAPTQVRFIRFGVYRTRRAQLRLNLGTQLCAHLNGDRFRHVVLQFQHIAEIALVGFCPKMPVARSVQQLRGDSYLLPGLHDRPFHNRIHVQFFCNFRQPFPRAFVAHYGSPRNHPQRTHLGEVRDQLIRYPIRKIFLRSIARQVGQWQNSDGTEWSASDRSARNRLHLPYNQPDRQRQRRHKHCQSSAPTDARRPFGRLAVSLRPRSCLFRNFHHGRDESVTELRDCLYITGILRGITQRRAQFLDCAVHAVLEIYERLVRPVRPQPLAHLLARDHFSCPLQQHRQNCKWLAAQAHSHAVFS